MNRKAPGIDESSNYFLKYCGEQLANELTSLFSFILETQKILSEWKSNKKILIFTKGNNSTVLNVELIFKKLWLK